MHKFVSLLVALMCIPACSQELKPNSNVEIGVLPRILTASERINLQIPMFGSNGKAVCDAEGNIVFNVGSMMSHSGPFLWVAADGSRHHLFLIPDGDNEHRDTVSTMTPDGRFYALLQDFKKYTLLRFKDDGSVDATSHINIPAGIEVLNLAITNKGFVFVNGYRDTAEDWKKPRAGFAAVFDDSGRMIRDLSTGIPQFDPAASAAGPIDGDAIAGEGERFYLLEREKILALNAMGAIINEIPLPKPAADEHPVRLDYSKGSLSILYHAVDPPVEGHIGQVRARTTILYAQSGEIRGSYLFGPNLTNTVLCFNAQVGYTMMAVDGNMAAIDLVPIR